MNPFDLFSHLDVLEIYCLDFDVKLILFVLNLALDVIKPIHDLLNLIIFIYEIIKGNLLVLEVPNYWTRLALQLKLEIAVLF